MRLNDTMIRNAKPEAKPLKLFDGDGLYLLIQPNGSRWWRMKYYFRGTEKTLSVGVYPEISLKQARERRKDIREQVAAGIDPSELRKAEKSAPHIHRHKKLRIKLTENHVEIFTSAILLREGQQELASEVEHFLKRMDAPLTEREWISVELLRRIQKPHVRDRAHVLTHK